MKKLNPIMRSKYIDDQYKEYLKSSFEFGTKTLQNLFVEQLEKEKLFKGPYVDMSFPFQRGNNLDVLISNNVLCDSFRKLGDIDFDRPLYSHQEESIDLIKKGRSVVITTGTGSGKTECFLYPIINEILSEIEDGNKEVGIRAIFLYPMNALINDQINRIRRILSTCPEITFGFFTGETEERVSANYRSKLSKENDIEITSNELVSREEIRENPPHLLFTNYSMLEYLLIRPNDYAIFEPERLKNWKFVVLDEAHSYYGSKGIEISLLLRRLTGLSTKKPQFILTSATLGEKGKSEKEIIEFAKNLTSVNYDVSDIIFSKRIKLQEEPLYKIEGYDYIQIKEMLKSPNAFSNVNTIVNRYFEYSSNNVEELVYDLLLKDKNVFKLSNILFNESKDFMVVYEEMKDDVSQEELIALIDLINFANKKGVGLFDLKYHSFVRPLSGAYITYGKEPKLSLTKVSKIDDMKAFEVGNCRYCNSPYIIGKIKKNKNDQLDYLVQNAEVDIYENYGDQEFAQVDYFLLENVVDEEEIENENLKPYTICAICGEIHAIENLNSKSCNCDDDSRFVAYKVEQVKKETEDSMYNNIIQCPCCGSSAQSGVVKALNIGRDEGTALIAQMLYEAIDDGEEVKKVRELSIKSMLQREKRVEIEKAKQYLAFSDSRQQASFFAMFFESNHIRLLRKRLIWEIIVKQKYVDMSVEELVSHLERKIEKEDLFENNMTAFKHAWAAILVDLLKVDGSYDGEGLGLYYFDLNLKLLLDELKENDIKNTFVGCDMTKDKLYNFMQVVLTVFKTTPAIDYSKSSLTPEEKKEILEYRRFNNYVTLKDTRKSKKNNSLEKSFNEQRSFLPIKGENKVLRYTMKAFDIDFESANRILETIFDLLSYTSTNEWDENKRLFIKHGKKESYQINAEHYIIKNYKNSTYYRCNKCGKLTPYNVNNVCVQDKCQGKLFEIDPDEVLINNYYRKQYKNKKIERIVIKEHTAQLDRNTAKEYQIGFLNKKINILSCSTTFEMGIDIGSLETVFMRNVPPTPANYVQRSGRAGRRKDSSAYILTYCDNRSHDYTYFSEPEKLISGCINPPYFNVLNKKIITRHLMATCLGYFFRNYPSYFSSLDELVISGDGIEKFNEYMKSRPKDLNEYINKKILPESIYFDYWDFKWFVEMGSHDEKLLNFVQKIEEMIEEFENAKKEAIKRQAANDKEASKAVTYFIGQIKNLKKTGVLESFSKYCVIPKYGFPVDVVDLQIYENGVPTTRYDMTRDLKIAISEYAPDSEVVVDGNKYVSKYITLRKQSELPKNWFIVCPKCNRVNISLSKIENKKCLYCGNSLQSEIVEYYIEPVYGFKSDKTKESTRLRPKRSYSGEVLYVGNGKKDEHQLVFDNVMKVETSSEDELLIMNKSSFYVCPICGYGEIYKGSLKPPKRVSKHKNFKQYDCHCSELNHVRLGHKFQTDIARFTIPILNSGEKYGNSQALSFLYAFLEGISIALGIERRDIDGVIELNLEYESYDILLYDNVPGGAGHVKRLLNKNAIISSLKEALRKINRDCCDEDTSCYSCLRNYYNQSHHNKLQRKLAIEVLYRLINELEFAEESHYNGSIKIHKKNTFKKLLIGNDGRNPGNESANEIWDDLLDDCFDENEKFLIKEVKENSPKNIVIPHYKKTVTIEETNEEFFANLIWETKHVILLLNDRHDDYLIAKKTGWHVFYTGVGFDIKDLIKKVGE